MSIGCNIFIYHHRALIFQHKSIHIHSKAVGRFISHIVQSDVENKSILL